MIRMRCPRSCAFNLLRRPCQHDSSLSQNFSTTTSSKKDKDEEGPPLLPSTCCMSGKYWPLTGRDQSCCKETYFFCIFKAAPTVFGWTTLRRWWHIMTTGGWHPTLRSSWRLWTRMWTTQWSRLSSKWNWSRNICLTRNEIAASIIILVEIVRLIAWNNTYYVFSIYLTEFFFYI